MSQTPPYTPTTRYGHPAAAVLGPIIIAMHHTGVLERVGLTPELALDALIGLATAAAVLFGLADWRHGEAVSRELSRAASDLRDGLPAEAPPGDGDRGGEPAEVTPTGEITDRIEINDRGA